MAMKKYYDFIIGNDGRALPNASVTVYLNGTTTLASLYSDANGTPLANPITTGQNGYFEFYADDGSYSIYITANNYSSVSITDILIDDTRDVKVIASNTTLNVPSEYTTIHEALEYLSDKSIANDIIVTIKVADGTYNIVNGINLNHKNGERIYLIGNQVLPENCTLIVQSPPTFSCLSCTNGHVFGLIDGFAIDLVSKATLANNYSGVYAGTGSLLRLGSKMKINNWYYGVNASYNSTVTCDYIQVTNAGDVGVWAFCGSHITARYATSNDASDVSNGLGYGFQAEFGSQIECSYSSATGCNIAGFGALSNSQLRAHSASSSSNTGSGFYARDGGQIENHNATAATNGRYGEEVITDGTISGSGKTISGNALGSNNGKVALDNGALGARIVASGDLRIDNDGTGSTYFNTSGGVQFAIKHAASAVNYWTGKGSATGNGLYLEASGSDTNVSANVSAKGNEVVRLCSNGKTALQAYAGSSSAVNYIQTDASVTGAAVTLSAQGSDSVIDLKLSPKGAGSYVQISAGWTNTGDVACNGYLPVKDNGGTVRKLMTTA